MAFRSPAYALNIDVAGITVASGVASAQTAVPVNSAGQVAHYVRVAATVAAHIRFGKTTATATANDTLLMPGDALVVNVQNYDVFAVIQDAAVGTVNVVPIEW
jgi:ubiquinone biosynthesis protein UbiJ